MKTALRAARTTRAACRRRRLRNRFRVWFLALPYRLASRHLQPRANILCLVPNGLLSSSSCIAHCLTQIVHAFLDGLRSLISFPVKIRDGLAVRLGFLLYRVPTGYGSRAQHDADSRIALHGGLTSALFVVGGECSVPNGHDYKSPQDFLKTDGSRDVRDGDPRTEIPKLSRAQLEEVVGILLD